MSNIYGRQVVEALVNKSGGGVIKGDTVIVDTSNNGAFTTSTSGAFTGLVGIAQETIASNATGRVLTAGYADLVNTSASVTRGNFGKTHTVVKQTVDAGSSRIAGTFCQFLTGGTTPTAHVFGIADNTSGAGTGTVTTVKDEGSTTSSAVVSLDFVGAQVAVTGTTAAVVTIIPPQNYQSYLSADVTMVNVYTTSIYSHASLALTLPVGDYEVKAEVLVQSANNNATGIIGYLATGGSLASNVLTGHTVIRDIEVFGPSADATGTIYITMSARFTSDGSTPIRIALGDIRGSSDGVILTTSIHTSAAANKASRISATRVTSL